MTEGFFSPVLFFVMAGLIGGLVLFVRGLVAYRRDRLISSVATSKLDGMAAGEVRVTGVVEAIDQHLVSPLQSKPCVWYRARVETTGKNGRVLLDEEKAQEFRITDETGQIRVVPRGARWEIEPEFDETDSWSGSEPPGLRRRTGSSYAPVVERDPGKMSAAERDAAVRALLTVQAPVDSGEAEGWGADTNWGGGIALVSNAAKRYREARLEPGETVTILGQALPWGDVRDALLAWDRSSNVEATIAADIVNARELGMLASSPQEAWGNAAIPGFGIGQPTAPPELDPRAGQPATTAGESLDEALAKYDIADEELVLSRGRSGGMAIYVGAPQVAVTHHDFAFALGVVGALMAVLSALGLGAILAGTL